MTMARAATGGIDPPSFPEALRAWRKRRGMTQLDLAIEAEVSQRHLSYLENGRAHPSREMVGHLARTLRVPPREQNQMLLAAGFAPQFGETDPADLAEVGRAIDFMLAAHEPNMAIVIDRHWNLVSGNAASTSFVAAMVPDAPLYQGTANTLHLMFHPDGLRPHITNFAEVAPALLWRLKDDIDRAPTDPYLPALFDELQQLAGRPLAPAIVPANAGLIFTVDFALDDRPLRLFSCLATLETAADLTVAELRVETFFPADEASRQTWADLHPPSARTVGRAGEQPVG